MSQEYLEADVIEQPLNLQQLLDDENECRKNENLQDKSNLMKQAVKSNKISRVEQQEMNEQTLVNRKKIPDQLFAGDEPAEEQTRRVLLKRKIKLQKSAYLRKNLQFINNLVQIKEIKSSDKTASIRGQVIFTWDRHAINERWAKSSMFCIEIYDGSGSVMVAIPQRIEKVNISNGQWVEIIKAEVREKYPKTICLLMTDKTKLQTLEKQKFEHLSIQPQKLGITVRELLSEPTGRICNVVCIIIKKSEKQYIETANGHSLILSHMTIYDPKQNCEAVVKLWEEKADLKFYCDFSVYLLRGIQIKEYKGAREYSANKDFTFRMLSYSGIEAYLRPVLDQINKLLQLVPEKYRQPSASKESKNFKIIIKQQATSQCTEKVSIQWKVQPIKIEKIQVDPKFTTQYFLCAICRGKVMRSSASKFHCYRCGSKNATSHYSLKFQFSNEMSQELGEIRDEAAMKLFGIADEAMKIEFFEETPLSFKMQIEKELIGYFIRGLMAEVTSKINSTVEITAKYLIDILPFEEEPASKKAKSEVLPKVYLSQNQGEI